MKNSLIKLIMFASAISLLGACNTNATSNSENTENTESNESSEITESSNSEQTGQKDEFIIELNKTIFVKGDKLTESNVTKFERWNETFEQYKPLTNGAAGVTWSISRLPEECPNGPVEVTLKRGIISAKTTVYYYEDIETAIKNTKIDIPSKEEEVKYLDPRTYIYTTGAKKGKLKFEMIEKDGDYAINLYSTKTPNTFYNKELPTQGFGANQLTLWDETGAVAATYDATKFTIPHYVNEKEETLPNTTYLPPYEPATSNAANEEKNYEISIDGNGHVAYLAKVSYNEPIDIVLSENNPRPKYWSYYKDYKTNPAFVFASDFNEADENKKFNYEKVIPQGGFWIVASCLTPTNLTQIDYLYSNLAGIDNKKIINEINNVCLTMTDDHAKSEESLKNAQVSYELEGKMVVVSLTAPVTVYHKYFYYNKKATDLKDDALIAKGQEVYDSLIILSLPTVKNEENLTKYYTEKTNNLINDWVKEIESKTK